MANNPEITILLDFYGEMLTQKQRDMIDFYYNDDLSLSEIAENEGITRQGVHDSIKRAEQQMYEMEERLHLCEKFRRTREGLETIRKCVEDISKVNEQSGFSFEITRSCRIINEKIEELLD
ncbi:MAG: YlxM family DNA-binding protein [Clostridia bacterium]|nr:YlxM family DNA-binding protein [Clostridia bacterium]